MATEISTNESRRRFKIMSHDTTHDSGADPFLALHSNTVVNLPLTHQWDALSRMSGRRGLQELVTQRQKMVEALLRDISRLDVELATVFDASEDVVNIRTESVQKVRQDIEVLRAAVVKMLKV